MSERKWEIWFFIYVITNTLKSVLIRSALFLVLRIFFILQCAYKDTFAGNTAAPRKESHKIWGS